MAYYSKKELTDMAVEGFALVDEFYGGGRRARKQPPPPNYGAHATYMVTSRPLPPPPATVAPTSVVAINHFSTASSSGSSRRWVQHGYNYHRYSPAESRVCWAPVVAMTTETTTTVVRGGDYDAQMLMDNFKY